jgi:hypothetical protein
MENLAEPKLWRLRRRSQVSAFTLSRRTICKQEVCRTHQLPQKIPLVFRLFGFPFDFRPAMLSEAEQLAQKTMGDCDSVLTIE